MATSLEYPVKPAILQACPAGHSGFLGERGGGGEEGMALAQRQCCLWAATAPAPAQCGEAEHMSSRRFLSRLCVATKAAMAGPRPVVMSGPSGAGKSTLLKRLLKDYEGVFGFSVSHTTRKPRPGEVNGKDYHFVTREDMLRAIDQGEFIEHAEFSGNLYGTSKSAVQAVQAQNQICVLDIDMQGVKNIKKTDLKPIYISVFPPSVEILEKRLRDRNTESEESLQKRLNAALSDMEISKEPGLFDQIIINDDLEEAYADLKGALSMEIHRAQKAVIS